MIFWAPMDQTCCCVGLSISEYFWPIHALHTMDTHGWWLEIVFGFDSINLSADHSALFLRLQREIRFFDARSLRAFWMLNRPPGVWTTYDFCWGHHQPRVFLAFTVSASRSIIACSQASRSTPITVEDQVMQLQIPTLTKRKPSRCNPCWSK